MKAIHGQKIKIPVRICMGCGDRFSKSVLNRYTITENGTFDQDLTGKMQGRGFYICNHINCFKKALKKKVFEKYMKNQKARTSKA